jgi:hypothetical protein
MNVTNEPQEETAGLTKEDLAIASYALAEVFNSFLAAYGEDDYGEGTKEEMEMSMGKIRTTFVKFDSLLQYINDSDHEAAHNHTHDEPPQSEEEINDSAN